MGVAAVGRTVLPGLLLFVVGTAIAAAYFFVPAVGEALGAVGRLKDRIGLPFGIATTVFFGGLVPLLLRPLQKRPSVGHPPLTHTLVGLLYWVYAGVILELFFRFQTAMFGDRADVATVAAKVAFDFAVYNPLWEAPFAVLFFQLNNRLHARHPAVTPPEPTGGFFAWYRQRVVPMLFTVTAIWLPPAIAIYTLPTTLQLPASNLLVSFWALILPLQVDLAEVDRRDMA